MYLYEEEVKKDLRNWNRLNHHQMDLYYIANRENLTEQEKQYYIQSLKLSKKDRSIPYIDRLLPPEENVKNQIRLLGNNYKDYKYFVYRFLNADGEVLYVGKSTNLYNRMFGHFRAGHLDADIYESIVKIEYIILNSKWEMNEKENYYIKKLDAIHNTVKKSHMRQINSVNDRWLHYDFLNELKQYLPELRDLKHKQIEYKKLLEEGLIIQKEIAKYADEIHQIQIKKEQDYFFNMKQDSG